MAPWDALANLSVLRYIPQLDNPPPTAENAVRLCAIRLILGGVVWSGCGGSGTGPGNGSGNPLIAKASGSGDGQTAPLGTILANPFRVIITQRGNPVAGRTVTWGVIPEGGQASPATSQTGMDGIASTMVTLPPIGTTASIFATANGADGSPINFTADATGAGNQVTVQVGNTFYSPDIFRLKQGGQVSYVWNAGASGHTVTPVAPNNIPASSNPAPPGTHDAPYSFDVTFPATGVFKFFCSTHGAVDSGMHGSVTVVP